MKILTSTPDLKISAENHLIEMSIGEYSKIAKDILQNNDLQRKRVRTSNRSYSLLKDDIKVGCVIPPIVLAIFPTKNIEQFEVIDKNNLVKSIEKNGHDLLILDGLQRTYTILDLLNEVEGNSQLLEKVKSIPLRIEVYTGISKVGVLYRMLTLNTGQTPMSTRHQVEMLYSDYKNGFDDIVFITESENRVPIAENEFRFSDIIDGFMSYITGDYSPIDREDLVNIIKNLELLTKDDKREDLFKKLVSAYYKFKLKVNVIANGWEYEEFGELRKRSFGKNVNEIFIKVQTISGFGAAISFLIEEGLVKDLNSIILLVDKIKQKNIEEALNLMIRHLDEIQINAKKIGNEQRMYFYYFIRSLFNEANDGYLDVEKSVQQAYKFYKANMLG